MSDMISREDAINALEKHEQSQGHNYSMFRSVVSECAEIIRDLPSAEPKHGKWIMGREKSLWDETDDGPEYTYATTWTCSECGYKRFLTSCPDDKYCKECGADMRETYDKD